ncbi:MAG: Txe/YoeB family addiction module toxin [Saprospiraceae bacterium]|nr:Txe/YoeB family addiction module toxin [Saprospiraceae bacterium]
MKPKKISPRTKAGNKLILNKLFVLLNELTIHPHTGTGKPEMLRFSLSGLWSRRINHEHRLVYDINDSKVTILSAKEHYF